MSTKEKPAVVKIVGGKKKLTSSNRGLFVVVTTQLQRTTDVRYVQVFFGRIGETPALDSSGTKLRPHVDFYPDGNGKYVRLGGHDCEIEGQMAFDGSPRTVRPQVVRVRSIELGVTAEIVFSTEDANTHVVQEIRFV